MKTLLNQDTKTADHSECRRRFLANFKHVANGKRTHDFKTFARFARIEKPDFYGLSLPQPILVRLKTTNMSSRCFACILRTTSNNFGPPLNSRIRGSHGHTCEIFIQTRSNLVLKPLTIVVSNLGRNQNIYPLPSGYVGHVFSNFSCEVVRCCDQHLVAHRLHLPG